MRVLSPAFRLAERRAVRGSRGVLAVCEAVEQIARRHDPSKLVARVEDTTLLTGDEEAIPPILPPGGPIVMYVGNLERYQGIDLLLEGFARALRRAPDARLVIVGGHPAGVEAYRARAVALGIADRTHFLGQQPVDRLGPHLRQSAVLVSPRLTGQNTPMKIYSYLDSGRPVVATRIPTHTQILDDEIACLVEPTPAGLGDGLVALLGDAALRDRLAARARARVQERYTPEAARRKLRASYAAIEADLPRSRGRA
jgi:glycosyltransferase involved in cell wall biosynthesis